MTISVLAVIVAVLSMCSFYIVVEHYNYLIAGNIGKTDIITLQ